METKKKLKVLYLNNKINAPYLFSMISNLVFDFRKLESNYSTLNGYDYPIQTIEADSELKQELAKHYLEKIPYWFDKELLRAYVSEDKSMRDLSKDTRISLTTIFHSLKTSKEYVFTNVNKELKKIEDNE